MPRQEFDTVDVVRLEVTRDPAGAEQLNLITNPDGSGGDGNTERRGGWGWSTPVDDTYMAWQWVTFPTATRLDYAAWQEVENYFQSQRAVVVGKAYIAATWAHDTAVDSWYACGEFRFYDANGGFVQSSSPSPWANGALGAAAFAAVPVGAYYVSLRIYVASNQHGADFPDGPSLPFYALSDVTMLAWDADPGLSLASTTNLLSNPTWDTSISGWSPSGNISSVSSPSPYQGSGCLRLAITANPSTVNSGYNATTAGLTYTFSARARIGSVPTRARAWIEFYNASNVLVGSRSNGALVTTDTTWRSIRVSATAPAGSTKALVGVQSLDSTNGTSYFDAPLLEQTNQANRWFEGTRSTPTVALPATPNQYWTEITEDVATIGVNRVAGDVGTITAEVISPALDPATNPLLSPGRHLRLSAYAGAAWRLMGRGRLGSPRTDYQLLNDVSDRNRITIEAPDAFAALAAARTTGGHAAGRSVANKFEQLGIPWNLFYARDAAAGGGDYYTADGSALDVLLIARDTHKAYAWVDVHGVITMANTSPHAPIALTPDDYNGNLRVSYDTANLVNSVTIVELVGATQTTYGPYEDGESIARWGRRTATYTVVPWSIDYTTAGYAADILAANAVPVVTVEGATIPIHTLDRIDQWAGLDLMQPLTVTVDELGYEAELLVQSITHSIAQKKWLLDLTFTNPDRVPIPTTGG